MIKVGTTSISAIKVGTTEVKKVCVGSTEVYGSAPTPTLDWFYVENATNSANTLLIVKNDSNAPTLEIEYSTDKNTWSSLGQTSTTDLTYSIPANGKVYLRCKTSAWASSSSYFNHIKTSGNCNVGGNIMSLLSGRDFTGNETTLSADYTFYKLFDSSYVVSASNLLLPATTLTASCYRGMLQSCTSLTSAPATLPATTLTSSCYNAMFSHCTSLTTSPSLPATTLADYCYIEMFSGCTSLTTAPTLSATTLAEYCYNYMFNGCTSLTTAPALPADTLAPYCYYSMFSGCTSLTTAPALSATTLANYCYMSMFSGCTSLTTAPTLLAMQLVVGCYYGMFAGCSLLNSITVGADVWDTGWSNGWLYGVAASGTLYNEMAAPLPENNASGIPSGWTEVIPDNIPFYLQDASGSANSVTLVKNNADAPTLTIEYSTSVLGPWSTLGNTDTTPLSIPIGAGSKTYLRCNASAWCVRVNNVNSANVFTTATGNFKVGGNVLSLLYGSNFTGGETSFPSGSDRNFQNMFRSNTYLTSAKMLILKATTLMDRCYQDMFNVCTSLTTAPALPADTLAPYCYNYMFSGCSSLANAPALPATTLTANCYERMFGGCTSLTTPPALPATTLAENCYHDMFVNCTNLTTAPALNATTLATKCYGGMFYGCTSLTTAPSLPATTLATNCYDQMFKNCTGLTTAPTLNATTLVTQCYNQMFNGCSSLNNVRIKATVWDVANASSWLNGVAASGTFYNDGNSNIPTSSVSGIPSGWTEVSDRNGYFYVENTTNSANTLSIISSSTNDPKITIYRSTDKTTWTKWGTTSSTTALTYSIPANSKIYLRSTKDYWAFTQSTGNTITCSDNFNVGGNIMSLLYGSNYSGQTSLPSIEYTFSRLFLNATKLISAAGLLMPATTLSAHCYIEMFRGCTSLTTAPELPATTLTKGCYQNMFYGCTHLTSIMVKFTTWPSTTSSATSYYATNKWTHGLPAIGTFYKKSGLSTQKNASGNATDGNAIAGTTNAIPYNWTVTNY